MKKLFFIAALFTGLQGIAQSDTKTKSDKVVTPPAEDASFTIVEVMPEFPGGVNEMMKYIMTNIKYPKEAKDKKISGTTYVTFVVEKDGSISNVRTLKGVPGGQELDEEAVRVVRSMPAWKPGTQNGIAVRTQYNLPVKFKL